MKKWIVLLILSLLGFSSFAYAQEIMLYDTETHCMKGFPDGQFDLASGGKAAVKPALAFTTGDQRHQVLLYQAAGDQPAQLEIVDLTTGATVKNLDLGSTLLKWVCGADRKQLLVAFQSDAKVEQFSLLYCDLVNFQTAIRSELGARFFDMVIAKDQKALYCTYTNTADTDTEVSGKGKGVLATLELPSLREKSAIAVNAYYSELIYEIDATHVALVERRKMALRNFPLGDVKVINLEHNLEAGTVELKNEVVIRQKKAALYIFNHKYATATSFVSGKESLKGRCNIITISPNGIAQKEFKEAYVASKYDPQRERMIVLLAKSMVIIDKNGETKQFKTENNYAEQHNIVELYPLPNSELVAVYNGREDIFYFYKINQRKPLAKLKIGRSIGGFFKDISGASVIIGAKRLINYLGVLKNDLIDGGEPVYLAVNPQDGSYYICDKARNEIKIFNSKFKKTTVIGTGSRLLDMYQFDQYQSVILALTEKGLYRIDFKNNSLLPVFESKFKNIKGELVLDGNRLVYSTDKELVLIDPATWQVRNSLIISAQLGETYTNIKPNEQRYFLVESN